MRIEVEREKEKEKTQEWHLNFDASIYAWMLLPYNMVSMYHVCVCVQFSFIFLLDNSHAK